MFYSGIESTVTTSGWIGLASSDDGIAWTKHDDPATTEGMLAQSDPVANPGICGGFDALAVQQPRVVAIDGELWMTYVGYSAADSSSSAVGLVRSSDGGVTWTCEWTGSALRESGLPAGGFVHTLNMFRRGDHLALLLEWFSGRGTDVWLAEAAELPR
jgi:hypothetical protein